MAVLVVVLDIVIAMLWLACNWTRTHGMACEGVFLGALTLGWAFVAYRAHLTFVPALGLIGYGLVGPIVAAITILICGSLVAFAITALVLSPIFIAAIPLVGWAGFLGCRAAARRIAGILAARTPALQS